MTPTIDVVVPTHNGWALTERCLRRLAAQTAPHTAIVVDSGSSDGTTAKVRERFPGVRIVELDANPGFSVACNRGAAAGDGDVLVLLNNDVEARPDFLEKLVRPLSEDTRLGSAAALLVQPGERLIDSVGLTADRTLAGFPRHRRHPTDEATAARPVLVGPDGAGAAYRRAAWEQVGGLDEGVRFYGEDLDLALRLRAAGWHTTAVPEAVAVHLGSATARRRSAWQRYESGFARGYFVRRYRVLDRAAARTLLTEAIVVGGDTLLSRDLAALRGRLAGWRAAKFLPATPPPPADAVDSTIGFLASLRLRVGVYSG